VKVGDTNIYIGETIMSEINKDIFEAVFSEKDIEKIERKYLDKYFYFLKFAEDELFAGFRTKEYIKDDWYGYYKSGISDFSVGAERIVYSLLNGKGIGQPNSAPVGSDLFFEVEDAYIHIDLKTVQTDNIGDCTGSIFVGTNQNSYNGKMIVNGNEREYRSSLPTFYNKGKTNQKICLTYFMVILYEKENLEILFMALICMPNGELEPHYKTRVLKAGKNIDKTRFRYNDVSKFELLENQPSRVKVIYFNESMNQKYKKKLKFFEDQYKMHNK
jgi:hypothetical protein